MNIQINDQKRTLPVVTNVENPSSRSEEMRTILKYKAGFIGARHLPVAVANKAAPAMEFVLLQWETEQGDPIDVLCENDQTQGSMLHGFVAELKGDPKIEERDFDFSQYVGYIGLLQFERNASGEMTPTCFIGQDFFTREEWECCDWDLQREAEFYGIDEELIAN